MQFLPILIAIVLGILALAFVLHPLYRRGLIRKQSTMATKRPSIVHSRGDGLSSPSRDLSSPSSVSPGQSDANQTERELAAREALQEIELDYQLGNIAEADYRTLRERYVRRALVALKTRYDRQQELDEAIEEQLRTMRDNDGDTDE